MNWLYLSWLGGIPCAWYCVNQTRARMSKWAANRRYRNIKQRNIAEMPKPEPQTYCAGCDQIVPESWMAWFDADCDGEVGELYRCRTCRGVPDPRASQAACDDRIQMHYRRTGTDAAGMPEIVEVHEDSCQCTNCNGLIINVDQLAHEQMVGRWRDQDFDALRGDDSLDLSKILAPEYTEAVENYRSHGVDATNKTDRIYRRRLAERQQRRQAELRAKYRMDTGEWRNNVKR